MRFRKPWLRVKSKLFSKGKNEKKWKSSFLELQVQQTISQTIYELGTSELAYSTRYNQYMAILY